MAVESEHPAVEVYWRPGCGFCSSMRAALASAGVDATWRNIWEDPEAAGFVRSAAGGNETVPTVRIGEDVMVAPRPRLVIDRLVDTDPALVSDPRRWPPLRIAQWITLAVMLVAANSVARTGHGALSLVIDAAAVAAYLGFRHLRSRRIRDPQLHRAPGQEATR
jgi:glutaredoxin